MTRTVLLLLIGAVAAVVHRVAQLVAVDAAVVAAAESERRLTLDVHCKFTKVVLKNLHGESNIHDTTMLVCVCVEVISYSTSEAPRLNCPRSRCRRRISTEAARTRGSCTRTGRGGSRCRWRSAALRGRNQHVSVSYISVFAPFGAAETLTAGRLVRVVQTVWVAVALEALGDAVAAAALEVAGVTSPQL